MDKLTMERAFEIVLELAQQNVIDEPDMEEEVKEQQAAIDIVKTAWAVCQKFGVFEADV